VPRAGGGGGKPEAGAALAASPARALASYDPREPPWQSNIEGIYCSFSRPGRPGPGLIGARPLFNLNWQLGRDLKRRAAFKFTSMADSDPWPPRPALNLKARATRVGKHNKLLRTAAAPRRPRTQARRRRCRDDSSRANLRQYRDGHTMQ
jgi:hypothetical protein